MSESTLKPFTGKLDENIDTNQQPALKPFTGALDGEKKGVMGHLKDTGLSALKGAVAVPELAVGIMDVMSDGAVGKTLENKDGAIGFRPKEAKQALGDLHTDQYKAQQQEFADAGKDGNWVDKVVDKTKVALTNPSLIANTVVESVPSMLAGGVLGRASGIANPVIAGAAGEGAVMAGSQAEQIRQETVDGRLTADQSLAGVTTGVLGGLIGFAGGRLAQKMGIGDVDTMLVNGRFGPADIAGEIASMPAKSLPRRVIEGAISEGFLEELPQSVSEQVIQNLALDKPWHDGIEDAAVMGTLAGMAMGGAANILSGHNTESQDNQQQSGSPNLPLAPPQLGSSPDSALTSEYIPRADQQQNNPNGNRANYEYTQFDTDSSNRLENNGFDNTATSDAPVNPNDPDTPPAPNGNYFDNNYGSEAAFDDLLNAVPPTGQTPSQQMGINPNDGPMSAAAALAVDSGATTSMLNAPAVTDTAQDDVNNNAPLSSAAGLLNAPNENNSTITGTNANSNSTYSTGNSVDGSNESSLRNDTNTPLDMLLGSSSETQAEAGTGTDMATQKVAEPILGADGKNKWFGSQEKAQAFLDKKNLGNDYQVAQDGKRFEIQPKSQVAQNQNDNLNNQNSILNTKNTISNTENNIDKIQKISALEQQLANEKSVIKKVRLRKQITELQNGLAVPVQDVSREWQISDPNVTLTGINKASQENIEPHLKKMENVATKARIMRDRIRAENPEIFTEENLKVRETHGLTNARVTDIADSIQANGSYELSDRELDRIQKNPNYKIEHDSKKMVAKVVAIKDPHSNEWISNTPVSDIDLSANQAATSVNNDLPEPTQAQIEAGNYKKGHIKVAGLDISIENPRGSTRSGKDPDGVEWSHEMSDHYGYINRTKGADNEHIDTYIGNNPDSNQVFIVDQVDQESGNFDEHKVMLGFDSQEDAITAYKSNFDKGWKVGPIRNMDMDQFKDWLKNEDTSKPAIQKNVKDSIENIRAEKIRQKDLADMHNSVYGLATDEQLQESLKHLNKEIKKAQKQSENEVVNGKRSTRKAVAAGALDRFLKNRVDLETYIKARKNGELKQRNKNIDDYSRDKLKPDNERRGASPLDTTFTPLSVVSATRRVLSILEHLKIVTTQIDASVRGRIVVGWQRVGVNKVKGLDSHSFTVQVVESFDGLPSAIQEDNRYQGENGETKRYDVLGVWHNGTLYINAGDIQGNNSTQQTTFEMYEELILHEVVGHFGVQQIFGREYKTKLQQLFNALGGLEGIRKIAKDNGVDMQQFNDVYINPRMQAVKDEIYTESDVQQSLVGELFAFVAQNAKSRPFVRQKLKEVLGYIRQWFRDRGFDKFLSRYNDADLMMFLSEARKAVVDQSYFGKYKDQKIETKQDSNIPQYSRNIKSKSPIAIQSDSEIGQTHLIPNHLLDSAHRLGDVVNDLASMRTEGVKANVPYAIKLLRNIAKLNPNVKIHIVSDLNNIQDKAIRAGLADGGFFVPEKNTSYIYPKSEAWESTVLELINHELVHTVTEYSLSHGVVSNQLLNELQQIREQIDAYRWENPEGLSENVKNRFAYLIGTNPDHETLAVGIAESEVRQALKSIIGESGLSQLDAIYNEISSNQVEQNEQRKQGKNTGNGKSTGNGNLSETESRAAERSRGLSEKTGSSQQYDGSTRTDQTDLSTGEKQQGLINNDSGVSITEENKVELASDKHNQGGNLSGNKSSEPASTIDAKLSEIEDQEKPLYSRRTKSNSGSTTQQVRDVLIDRFGKETIDELERQGKLEIIQDYQVEGVEGFYYNGKAVLVASNLTAESTVPTFLHELGGHAGFQNMMTQKQYNELMNQFNKLVDQGNPVALAAKMLAEREQGSERQQLEYLPYLLTLSATMQQRNVLQRNALQKLINNIISYVKAWVFDHFGINLNLNPDDMLALSERMIGQIKHQSSLDLIRQKYHGTDKWMTAPNGAKTHLSEQQWLQVRTPEFKKWFGDWENDAANASQVLDENGEPKVVYHGTATEFNEFKQGHGLLGDGIYLTDSFDTADVYANIRGENGFVLPLFVNIRNAFKTTGNVSRDEFVEATTSGKYQGIVHQFENQEYIVALEPNQVKMAEGNKGTFNSESSDIRFSRSSNDVADRLSENIKNLYSGNFKLPSMADAMKYGLMFLSRMQITDIYKKILPQLSVYNDLVHQMDADKNDIAAHADNIVREWAKLNKRIDKNDPNSKTEEEALADLMHEATLAQIDPAKPYQSGDDKVKYQQLYKAYNALSPEARTMYKKARDAYSGHYAKVREAVRERILRSALSSERKADLLKKIEGSFGQIKGVYFPLARFGQYVVVARNQNGDVESISRAETENEAKALREQLIEKYPQLKVDSVIRDQEYNALRDKVGRGFMSDLFDEVGNLGLDAKKQAEFEDTLGQLYLSSMPDLSWAKHGIHRKGTAGFSNNARRAFAQNMSSGASYLAKLRYGDQLAQQLDEMEEYAKAQIKKDPSYKQPLASAVIDEMNKRHENLMNAKGNAVSSLLTSMGFIYFLGLSPAAAMVNILQTPLVAYPILGAKFGFDKAGIALLGASTDYAKGVGFEMPDFTDLESFRNSLSDSIDPDIAKVLKEHEKQAYEKAVSAGVIDVTQAHDLAGIAQGEDSGVMWKMRPIMRAASLMFHHAERFNREVTFIAAYRLSKESGMADHDAYKQAVKMTYDGHFDYSASNRARFMQGNVAKVIFLFKQFGQNMIYTIARQTYQSIKGESKQERTEARRAISAMLVTHALAAGVLGLPMVTTLLAVASMFGGGDDDPWDAEVALRNGLADMTSPKFSNLVMKGLSRGTSADLSGRVGLDSMFLARAPDGLEGQKLYEQLILGNMGATVGMGANIAKGIQELGQGNYARALEEMLPTFAKNPFKAYRYATEGVQDKTGVDIMDGNPVSGAGIFSQTIGFSPSQVRTAYEGKSAIYQQQQALQKRKSKLTANWVRAKRNDDQEGMDSAWKDIQEFNEVNPKLRINRINLMQSYHQNAKRIRDAENGVYLSKKYRDIGDYGRFAETD